MSEYEEPLPNWETVTPTTDRLRVPGGWLYRTLNEGYGAAVCFVPDDTKRKAR